MELFDVYPRLQVEPVRADGWHVWDSADNKYLDFYGGHAVISIGHAHPRYIGRLINQVNKIGFYSNSVLMPIQDQLAEKLGEDSGYPDWSLFLCNSGAEANENALKLASAHNQRKKIIAYKKGFHGRTSLAVAATDNPNIVFPVNEGAEVIHLELNDLEATKEALSAGDVSAVIIEGIQGIGGIHFPDPEFLKEVKAACEETGTYLIMDEIQSGFGRSGKFFAHQWTDVEPDLITIAKGMGNGFPVGGVLISPKFEAKAGMLGTTFGGNHLACAATLAVLEVLENENLIDNANTVGDYLLNELDAMEQIKDVRGAGLMIGLEFDEPVKPLREKLLNEHRIFTGSSSDPSVLRILPPLTIGKPEADQFLTALKEVLA